MKRTADAEYITVGVGFGAFSPPLREQMAEQGLVTDPGKLDHLESDRLAVVRLTIRGVLTQAEGDRVRRRLVDRVAAVVEAP